MAAVHGEQAFGDIVLNVFYLRAHFVAANVILL